MNKTQKALNKMGSVGSNLLVMTVGRGQAPLLPFNYKSRQSDRERLEVKKIEHRVTLEIQVKGSQGHGIIYGKSCRNQRKNNALKQRTVFK